MYAFIKTTLKDINKKKRFSYLSKLEAEALVKTFLFHKPNLALFSSYFSQEQNTIYSENFRFDPNSKSFSGSNQSLHFKFGLGMIIGFHSFFKLSSKKSHTVF